MSSVAAQSGSRSRVRLGAGAAAVATVLIWLVGFFALRGRQTLPLGETEATSFHQSLNHLSDNIAANRNTSPIFVYFLNYLQIWMTDFVTFIQQVISIPGFGRTAPFIGWMGVIALVGLLAWWWAGWKNALLAVVGFGFLGAQGLWQESMDTLALTLAAVLIAIVIGVPLGVWIGLNRTAARVITPLLDFMQIMPTFVYLAPLTLLFLIGPAAATIAVLIYAIPPVIRITGHGIRSVPETTVEAGDSLGVTGWQRLRDIQLPMARRTIVMGINQTTMAALSMVTIAALISAPGLGQVVLQALQSLDVGRAFNGGLAIVVLAIVLDRTTSAISERTELADHGRGWELRARRIIGLPVIAAVAFAVYLSHTYVYASTFPSGLNIGPQIVSGVTSAADAIQNTLSGATDALKNAITNGLLNPLQTLLTESPFWLVMLALVALAAILGGRWTALTTAICLGLIIAVNLWQNSMETLASTLIATILTMAVAVVLGVWMGRSRRADQVIRPVLDAGQVMPAFVYLVPFLVLFSASRFTAIVSAMVYAVPVAAKVIADGIRGVPETTVEAATSAGASTWQIISQVQVPMAARSLALATNQGLIYVLAMVVVGGMVGAGGLGYQVVNGFVQDRFIGKGLAAGLAIVFLGIMLDRVSQAVASRVDPSGAR